MASSSSSSSSEAHFIPNCVYPLLRPTVKRNYQNGSPQHTPIDTIRELHDAITWTVDKYSRQLRLLASRSPVFKNILSFSSHFHQHLSQVRRESYSNVKLLRNHNFAAVLPGDSVAGLVVANGILNFLNIYNTLLVVRLVLTWFPNTPPAIVSPLSTLCDPYLNIFRGIIPPLGGTLDLSPILALVVLNAFTSTAAALPAELPHPGASLESSPRRFTARGVTSSQEKWMRRLCGRDIKSSSDAN